MNCLMMTMKMFVRQQNFGSNRLLQIYISKAHFISMSHLPKSSHISKKKNQKITAPFWGCFLHIQGIFINNNSKNKLRKKAISERKKS